MQLSILPREQMVVVDGEAHHCDFRAPSDMLALRWDGQSGECDWASRPTTKVDAKDYATFMDACIEAWRDAKRQEASDKSKNRWRDESREALAQRETERKQASEALAYLQSSDHEIIKQMERLLHQEGVLDPDLVQARERAREAVRNGKH